MFWIDFISRFTHIFTAIALIGGSVFMLSVLLPSVKLLSEDAHASLSSAITARWKRFVHSGIALFLLSGLYNFVRALPLHKGDSLYHGLIGTKILLALGVFFIASALVGRSERFSGMRQNRGLWLTVLVGLATLIVLMSSYAKVRGSQVPPPPSSATPLMPTPR